MASHPDSNIVVLSSAEDLAAEFVFKVDSFLHHAGLPPKSDPRRRLSRVLPNGSRILGMAPGQAPRPRPLRLHADSR